jgi:ribonuclease HII
MICGIDEAGRGPVIGPLVVAGVLLDEKEIKALVELRVRDSKLLSPKMRRSLYKEINKLATCNTIKIPANELDKLMSRHSLNKIEARYFAAIIEKTSPSKAYIDAADVSCRNFEQMITGKLKFPPQLIVEHKADEKYPIVAAASIVAKVERDREIKRLHKTYGDFGSGYASDEKTQRFLERYFKEHRSFPECVRRRWKTTGRASNLKLEDFY